MPPLPLLPLLLLLPPPPLLLLLLLLLLLRCGMLLLLLLLRCGMLPVSSVWTGEGCCWRGAGLSAISPRPWDGPWTGLPRGAGRGALVEAVARCPRELLVVENLSDHGAS